jgi:hypothetical protein
MSSPGEGTATTLVIELKPGWIYVKMAELKPDPERIELLLRLTVDHWFSTRPQFVIERTQAVIEHGILQGINIWYHDCERQCELVSPEPSQQPFSLTFEVHDQVYQQVPKERIEALVEEALEECRPHQQWHGTLAVINPGRIAVILDRQGNRGALLPVELVYPRLEETTIKRVQTWLEAPPTRRHVILIDGSWFMPQKTESARDRIKEPDSRHTNMPYDTGPRQRE